MIEVSHQEAQREIRNKIKNLFSNPPHRCSFPESETFLAVPLTPLLLPLLPWLTRQPKLACELVSAA